MSRIHLIIPIAAAAVLVPSAPTIADIVVGDDFFYKQPSRTDTSYGDVRFGRANYGGGVNGALGIWESKWAGLGSGSIISDDVIAQPYASNPYTARFNGENTVNNDIQRSYSLSDTLSGTQTLYFGGKFKVTPSVGGQAQFAEFGILTKPTVAGDGETGAATTTIASIGIENGTFFAHAGGRDVALNNAVTLGNPGSVAGDTVVDDVYYTIIGKLEFNVSPSTIADYNGDGSINAADYTVWRDNSGIGSGATFEQGDGTGDGKVDAADYQLWSDFYGAYNDRVTAYINPVGVGTSAGSTLVAEAVISNSLFDSDIDLNVFLSGGYDLAGTGSASDAFVDDIVIGTSWNDVTSLLVPRLNAIVNTTTGAVTLVNNTSEDVDLGYYEIVSSSGALLTTWNSLHDQGVDSGEWLENNPSATRLTESNLLDSTTLTAGGGSLTLPGAFNTSGAQDLVVRWGVKEGAVGLLNLANLSYSASAVTIPEPGAFGMLVLSSILAAIRRCN